MTATTIETLPPAKAVRISDFATREELTPFTTADDFQAMSSIVFNYVMVALIFAGVAIWTNPLTILLGIALLGGRQLGFAALMHDCGHRTLFSNKKMNDIVGQWLCAYPILSDLPRYAAGHRQHHARAGTRTDPDLPNYQNYPITRSSFRRKIMRDLTGQTGWKALRATWRRGKTDIMRMPWNGNAILGHALMNGAMFAVLYLCGAGWLYLMWPVAFLTSYMLIARMRQVAEHGAVPDLFDPDPRMNTRTMLVRWWEKPFMAPFGLNYHLEHHFHSGIPCYHLEAFHRFLEVKGVFEETEFPKGYGELFAKVVPA